jgi:hypothetical protein
LRNLIEQLGLRALAHFGQFSVQQQVRSNQLAAVMAATAQADLQSVLPQANNCLGRAASAQR